MPVLNNRGQAVSGVGDGIVSIDGVEIARGGCACWLTDDEIIFNGPDNLNRWALRSYNQKTKEFKALNPSGANFIAASEGRYAAQAGNYLYANFPFHPGSAMSLTGTDGRGKSYKGIIALCTTSDCLAFDLYAPSEYVQHVDGIAYGLAVISENQAIWDNGEFNFDLRIPIELIGKKFVKVDDEDWIVGWNDKWGLIAVENGQVSGYVLETQPIAFNHDAHEVNGELVVCWSTTQGEGPNDLVKVTVDRTKPRTVFIDVDIPPIITDPPLIREIFLMEPQTVSLIAFDHYARVVGNRVVFDQTQESAETEFEMSQPDELFAFKKNGRYLGVDSTVYMQSPTEQYYMTNNRQGYESFFVGVVSDSGLLVAFVQYFKGSGANNTESFISVPITVKRKV